MLNFEQLLEPLTDASVTGENLEYDFQFTELLLKAQGTPDRVDIVKDPDNAGRDMERITPGKEPDAKLILDSALALFKRTKDLRIAVYLVYGLTRINGLAGLSAGTELISRLLNQYWDDIHPRLDSDDDMDPFMRINALNAICDPAMLLRAIRNSPLAEARAIGHFTLRDLDVANGEAAALEGLQAATPELLQTVCVEMDQSILTGRLTACKATMVNLTSMTALFNEKTSSTPDFAPLLKLLKRAVVLFESTAPSVSVAVKLEQPEEGVVPTVLRPQGPAKVSTRVDAKKLLEQACHYLEQAEPAHPSPLLIRRAIRLLDMNFMDIVRELTPDALREVEHLGGIRNE